MNHYTVAVITKKGGQSVDELLAPFDEGIEVDRYIRNTKQELIDKKKKEIKEYAENGPYSEYIKNPEEYAKKWTNPVHLNYLKNEFPKELKWSTDEEFYAEAIRFIGEEDLDEDGNETSTYNPKSKWDWYTTGGRWSCALTLKDGTREDSASIKEIDFNPTEEEIKKAEKFWELYVEKGIENLTEEEKDFIGFVLYKKEYYKNYYKDKDDYVKRTTSFSTYAVLTPDGKWHEPGPMGWFGMSGDSPESKAEYENSYYDSFIKPYVESDEEYIFTIVDCHI